MKEDWYLGFDSNVPKNKKLFLWVKAHEIGNHLGLIHSSDLNAAVNTYAVQSFFFSGQYLWGSR